MTGWSLGGGKAMEIKGNHQYNTTKLIAELKMVLPPPLTYNNIGVSPGMGRNQTDILLFLVG